MKHTSSEIIAPFRFNIFRLTIEAVDRLYLPPYKGSALRGGFGHAFRRIVCVIGGSDCQNCSLIHQCIYPYIFETLPSQEDTFLRNRDKVSHPYIIRPPLEEREIYEPGEQLIFDLVLIGKSADFLPYFAYTFIQMGKIGLGKGRGKFILRQIETTGLHDKREIIYQDAEQILKRDAIIITCRELSENRPTPARCTFRFLTWLEIKEKRGYPEIHFGVLFRSLLRRITTLAHLHCDIDCSGIDFKELSHAADNIKTVSSNLYREHATRYSNRQQRRMPFGGISGKITFEGDFTPFWSFLLLGEAVHVGKKTSFGLGQYIVT